MHFTNEQEILLTDEAIVGRRTPKNRVDPLRPYAYLVEPERSRFGVLEDVAVIFLTNRECPFRCTMCDLWKYTTDERVPDGAIAGQMEYALERLPPARQIKLYNAGNFFDSQAIPRADWPRIRQLASPYQTLIVECHPRLVGPPCLAFQEGLVPEFEIAMGLETAHPEVLARLNKRMTLEDFARATRFLVSHGIGVRAFILLKPPFLNEAEGIHWAKESLLFAFDAGVECCVIIPMRAGNGTIEVLERRGEFSPPRLDSLEEVLEFGIGLKRGRVFADLWDADKAYGHEGNAPSRLRRLQGMNWHQQLDLTDAEMAGGLS